MVQPSHPFAGTTLRTISLPVRVLFSFFLISIGLGYLSAITLLFLSDIDPHRKMGMGVVLGVAAKYYGDRENTRLESAVRGSMAGRMSEQDQKQLIDWLHDGARKETFAGVQPILERSCTACHSAKSGLPIPSLTSYEEVKKLAQVDSGYTWLQLARVSHVHLFGISIIFLLTGAIFVLSEISWKWRLPILAIPYLAIWADIGSWWITKFQPGFAWVVVIGGAFMGLALAAQILIALWEMWLAKPRT